MGIELRTNRIWFDRIMLSLKNYSIWNAYVPDRSMFVYFLVFDIMQIKWCRFNRTE
jgi:hypothetical protein